MVTTTYHTSSSDSSLISLTDEEVIYKKDRRQHLHLRERERRERERERESSLTRMILLSTDDIGAVVCLLVSDCGLDLCLLHLFTTET